MSQTAEGGPATAAGVTQRQHILDTALSLMAQRGVDGTSMRELAASAGLNVASLYHYFPSKRDLLVAVLAERGYLEDLNAAAPESEGAWANDSVGGLVNEMLQSMLDVEDFIRLMLGEVMRGDDTAFTVGTELFETTQRFLEHWLEQSRPDLCQGAGAPAVARILRATLVGLFFEHVAGVLEDEGNPSAALAARARELDHLLGPRPPA